MNSLWDKLPPALRDNPFFYFSEETDYVPAWDRIQPQHVMPALEYAFGLLGQDAKNIAANKNNPTFRNTVEALEAAFGITNYFFGIYSSIVPRDENQQKEYDVLEQEIVEKYEDLYHEIFTNDLLFQRFKNLSALIPRLKLSPEKKALHKEYIDDFIDKGILYDAQRRSDLHKVGQRIAKLATRSQQNMRLAEEKSALIITKASDLDGLPEFLVRDAAAEAQKRGKTGKWVFGIGNEIYDDFMKTARSRDVRRKMWQVYHRAATSGPHDNRKTIIELMAREHEYARLTRYRNPASYTLKTSMAGSPGAVAQYLNEIRIAAKPVARHEMDVIRQFAKTHDGVGRIMPWDVDYYQERIGKIVLGFDQEEIRPWFELEHVLQACFRHFGELLELDFEEVHGYSKYHEDLRFFKVTDTNTKKPRGLICMDLYAREFKAQGIAWNMGILSQGLFEGKVRRPLDMIVTKFIKGQDGDPTLIGHYGALTLLHELGHSTHNMVSQCEYQNFSGTSVSTDFLEFPSYFQEEYGYEPELLKNLARHYKTGLPLPSEVMQKISDSRKFMAGLDSLNRAQKGWLDLSWYRKKPQQEQNVETFESAVLKKFRLPGLTMPLISPRFSYTFGGGYESTYFSYQWSERMAKNLFRKFKEAGLYDFSLRRAYRSALEKGGSVKETTNFRSVFKGNPDTASYLQDKGLHIGNQFNYSAALDACSQVGDNNPNIKRGPAIGGPGQGPA